MVADADAAPRRTVDAAVGTVGASKVSTAAVPLMIGTVVTFASDGLLGVSAPPDLIVEDVVVVVTEVIRLVCVGTAGMDVP